VVDHCCTCDLDWQPPHSVTVVLFNIYFFCCPSKYITYSLAGVEKVVLSYTNQVRSRLLYLYVTAH
jgi:hypothetical protein